MEINQIEAYLKSPDSQDRLKALTELRHYEAAIAVPLLMTKLRDPEFLVRSFVAMGLGRKQSEQSFHALLKLLHEDSDHNVRAEASNSLSMHGEASIPHLLQAFRQDTHWLVRRSILAALGEMQSPEALFEVCVQAIADEDQTVCEAAIDSLCLLAGTPKQAEALAQILPLASADWWRTRAHVARALRRFDEPQAKTALSYLSRDEDYRVIGAALEASL